MLRDNDRLVLAGLHQLVVTGDDVPLLGPIERAFWRKDVHLRERSANVFKAQTHLRERHRIHLHTHSGVRAATNHHLTHAVELAYPLAHNLIGQIVNLR